MRQHERAVEYPSDVFHLMPRDTGLAETSNGTGRTSKAGELRCKLGPVDPQRSAYVNECLRKRGMDKFVK